MLNHAASTHPNSWWWLKADGVDVVAGIGESMRMKWSGDVDLNNGDLEEQYNKYIKRLDFIEGLGLNSRQAQLLDDLTALHDTLGSDLSSVDACKFKLCGLLIHILGSLSCVVISSPKTFLL